jgi:hypothetical protein
LISVINMIIEVIRMIAAIKTLDVFLALEAFGVSGLDNLERFTGFERYGRLKWFFRLERLDWLECWPGDSAFDGCVWPVRILRVDLVISWRDLDLATSRFVVEDKLVADAPAVERQPRLR